MGEERRGDGKGGGGGDVMRDYCEVGENGWGVGIFCGQVWRDLLKRTESAVGQNKAGRGGAGP